MEKELSQLSKEELIEIQKPIAKALYKNKVENNKTKKDKIYAKPTDRITCKYCGRTYIRSGKFNHDKTLIHKAYVDMNNKLRQLLIEK
jgi:hypothetical protein